MLTEEVQKQTQPYKLIIKIYQARTTKMTITTQQDYALNISDLDGISKEYLQELMSSDDPREGALATAFKAVHDAYEILDASDPEGQQTITCYHALVAIADVIIERDPDHFDACKDHDQTNGLPQGVI
jgi:hypothetical protein